jgi:hypothetical protein
MAYARTKLNEEPLMQTARKLALNIAENKKDEKKKSAWWV